MTSEKGRGTAWRAAAIVAAIAAAGRAEAALGQGAESVAADREALAARAQGTLLHAGYTVELMKSSAHEVREFVSPAGVVFAVAWDGISHPDLGTLLGAYAPEYRAAAGRSAPGRRSRVVKTASVVVETWGHMRGLHGRAWVPALVPAGVTVDAIR